ncbi:MAG TPA: hypothetical protein VJ182_06590 [Anaerolineales bacterium]|nr:hypothetical protein [Anaerolineales bacterium]
MKSIKRPIPAISLAWFAMLGVDFLLHGALLAGLYAGDSSFLLPPLEAFRRIPLGYTGFLLLAILLVWILPRFSIDNWKYAFWFGIKLGAILWGSFVLGLMSISPIEFRLAAAWFLGQTLELGVGAAVVEQASREGSLRRIASVVILIVILAIVITVALQSFGIVPTTRIQ